MFRKALPCLALLQLLLLTGLAGGVLAAYPSAAALTSGIVIYPDRAMVKKILHVTASKGENTLEITGLTPSLLDDSVQAGIRGADRTRIVDIEVRRSALVKTDQERIKELQDEIDKIDRELVRQGNALAVQKNSLAFLQKVVPFPQNQNTSFPTVRDYLAALEQSMGKRLGKAAEIELVLTALNKKKAELEQEKRNLGPGHDDSKTVLVTVYAEAPLAFDLEYSYFLTDVQWTPKYEVRADSLAERLELNFFAIIRQGSGEDLSGAKVEISTARPAVSGDLPELHPWWLDIYAPPVYQEYGRTDRAAEMKMLAAPQAAMIAAEPADDAGLAPPEIRSEATSLSYVLAQRIALPSDNQPHKILVSSSGCEAKFEYLAVPRFARFAALTAKLKNPFLFPLLTGVLNVFLDGRFVSTSRVTKPVASGDELRLSLGLDETIVVSDKLQKQFTEETGAFSRKIRKHYEYQAEIVNGKTRPITLLVRDHLPVSAHEEIEVKVTSPTAKEAKIGEGGIVTWTLSLTPGEKRQLTTIFDITYPEGREITGL